MVLRIVLAGLLSLFAASAQAETLLVLPFENSGRDSKLEWIGEGLAELSIERLAGSSRTVFPREEWLAALERMGLPVSTRFSHATMLKIAEEMDADYVVFGGYSSDGKSLSVTARVLRLNPPGVSAALAESGALEDLMEIHARLAWQLLRFVDPGYPLDQRAYVRKFPRLRLDAFEHYIRGLLASEDEQRLRFFRETARLDPEWTDAAFALAQTYFSRRDCDTALIWFSKVAPGHERGLEANFYAGVCHLLRSDAPRAEAAFASVLERARLPEVLNNLGVAKARLAKGQEAMAQFERAQQLDPEEPDYWFNLGLAALRANEPAAAVRAFRELLRRKPDDAEARALLISALERSGRQGEAVAEREASPAALPALAAEALARLDRIKMRLDTAPLRLSKEQDVSERGLASLRRAQHTQLHLARGRQYLAAGKIEEAQREFAEAVRVAPETSEPRIALAEVYHRQNRPEDAMRELRSALWIHDDAGARTTLARLFLEQNRTAEARAELRAALKLDPTHAEARRLLDSLEAPTGPGEIR